MLILCAGVPRTGSTFIWQMMGDLVLEYGGIVPTIDQNVWYWAEEWGRSGDTYLAKTHNYKSTFDRVQDRILAVMTVRDPRDVVVSLSHFLETTPRRIIEGRRFRMIDKYRREMIERFPEDRLFIIRYEDFSHRPTEAIFDIGEFIGMPVLTARAFEISGNWTIEKNKARVRGRKHRLARDFVSVRHIHSGEVGQFYKELTVSEIKAVEDMAGDWMDFHGYYREFD